MKIKDYIFTTIVNLSRDKKNIIHILIMIFCIILSFAILVFNYNFEKLLNYTILKEVSFRTISTLPRSDADDSNILNIEKDIEDLKGIEHVIDVFPSSYKEVLLDETSLANDNLDGKITLHRGLIETLPSVIAGRDFKNDEREVAICPINFYPNSNPQSINKNYLIDGKKLIGTTFDVKYYDYILNDLNSPEKNKSYTKTFKIIGLYDNTETMNDNGTCYVPKEDVIEIIDKEDIDKIQSNDIISIIDAIRIVFDDPNNVEYVSSQIEKIGFENPTLDYELDQKFINAVRLSITSILILVILVIIVITISYTKKKIIKEEKTIGILRAIGYSKNEIKYQYTLEVLLINLFSFIIGTILFLIVFYILTQNIKLLIGINFILGGIKINVLSFIISFLITVILPILISIIYFNKKFNIDIVKLIGSDE